MENGKWKMENKMTQFILKKFEFYGKLQLVDSRSSPE